MKVLNIGTSFGGGAGIAMRRISQCQAMMGLEVETWALKEPSQGRLAKNEKLIHRSAFDELTSSVLTKFQSQFIQKGSPLVTSIGLDVLKKTEIHSYFKNFDAVSFHSIYNLTTLKTIAEISKFITTFVTLHDQRILTGGCHYSYSCKGYLDSCLKCPQVNKTFSAIPRIQLAKNKKEFFSSPNFANITLISPSTWLAEKVFDKIGMQSANIKVVANPIPKWNVDPHQITIKRDKQINIGFMAENLNNPYKGLSLAIEAINRLAFEFDIKFTAIGRGTLTGLDSRVELSRKYVENDTDRISIYREQDFMLVPSLQDNFPSVVSEALMCGTPVIGSDTGGIPEMLMEFEMPIVSAGNVEELIFAIRTMPKNFNRIEIISKAQKKYSYETIGKKYLEIFHSLR